MIKSVVPGTLVCLLALASCEEKGPPPMPPATPVSSVRTTPPGVPTAPPAPPAAPAGATGATKPVAPSPSDGEFTVGGVLFRVPAGSGWKPAAVAPGAFAPIADLRFAHSAGEARAAFFAVGGGVQANLDRWKRQLTLPGGAEPIVTTSEVNGLKVTRIDMTGEYRGMNPSGGAAAPAANTRFIGIVIEGGASPVQVRITGPAPAVTDALTSFDQMLTGIRK